MPGTSEAPASATQARVYDRTWREVYGDLQEHGPTHRHMRRLVGGMLSKLDYRDALDVGCGAGHNYALLAGGRAEHALDGADISPEALRRARARGMRNVFALDIEREALPRRWELVFCSLVLEHLSDDTAALRHMLSMSSRHLVLTTIAGDFDRYHRWERQLGHVRNYRRGELEAKLEAAGATVTRALYWGFPWYSPLTRVAQNHWRVTPSFGAGARLAARALEAVYWLNSHRRGDLLIVHATVARADAAGDRTDDAVAPATAPGWGEPA